MTIIEAINQLKQREWIDLTHSLSNKIPYFPAFSPLKEKTIFTIKEDGFFAKEYTLATQYGTHIDAPGHFAEGRELLEELSLQDTILPLYVIHKEREVEKNPDYELTEEDILTFEKEHGKITSGSFVAFASGWSKKWENHEAFYNKDELGQGHTPGWSIEALTFLHEKRNVRAIGHETLDTDSGKAFAENNALLGELYWLSTGNFQVEALDRLYDVPSTGGAIVIGIPKIEESPGFTVRAFAIV
ncbi:cyclase family protein [Vagococcus bubulae]|uniref:Cyclase n=1 Tax=Vagococcus bubulae TaxID=1977868 RepID=A0A429ZGN7_9ENTE|nr:cyclase family protein [Vagococcus bubulae]RST92819.1 cyclase [Vagococcus bubulae]